MEQTRHIVYCSCSLVSVLFFAFSYGNNSETINNLSKLVYEEQIKQTQQYTNISHLEELEGIYRNYIHLNVYGSEEKAVLRRDLRLMDNNPFISGIVALQILDAFRFGNTPMPPTDEINRIVKLYADSHDMNADHETSLMLFFQQRYNADTEFWQTYPTNIIRVFQAISNLPRPYYQKFLDVLLGPQDRPEGLDDLFSANQIADRMRIPADFDSSSTHLCFGSILHQLQDIYPDAWASWRNRNTNLSSIFDAVKKYAYRPFSNDPNSNTIDTRSYFFMKEFLDDAMKNSKDLAIVPTWAMNIDDERIQHKKGIAMPWGVNIIDMTIIANFMAGVWSTLDTGLLQHDLINKDQDLKLIIGSSASLMVYFLQHNLTGRPDLSLAYYPSTMEFYWFVARGLLYMENAILRRGSLDNIPVFSKYYNELKNVMRSTVTQNIQATRKFDEDGTLYFDDFLGNNDVTFDGKPINRAEDRYYTTAMAANCLIYTWCVYDEGMSRLRWIDSVPEEVKATIYSTSDWLTKEPYGGKYGAKNVFFSVSEKNRETIPLWFPANRYEHLNGTKIPDFSNIPEELTVFGMEGYVGPRQYRDMLEVDQFGMKTQQDFHGYDSGQGAVIFWSCKAVSYAGTMMALSMTDYLK